MTYDAKFSAVYLDGQLAAEGGGVSVWPDDTTVARGFCLGGDAAGASLAGGQFDELVTLDHPYWEPEVEFNYWFAASASKLGPISAEEDAARQKAAPNRRAEREAALAEQQNNPMMMMMQSSSICDTNGPVRLTNIVSSLQTNGAATVSFDIQGGVDYELYDVFRATNLVGGSITNSTWRWLEQGPTCYSYTYTNEPFTQSSYVLGTREDSDFDGLPDGFDELVLHTSPLLADTDGDGVPDGDEDADQNGIPDWAVPLDMNPTTCSRPSLATSPTKSSSPLVNMRSAFSLRPWMTLTNKLGHARRKSRCFLPPTTPWTQRPPTSPCSTTTCPSWPFSQPMPRQPKPAAYPTMARSICAGTATPRAH